MSALLAALGGGVITTLSTTIWALIERGRAHDGESAAARWKNAFELASTREKAARDEMQAERALRTDDKRRLEGIISQYQLRARRLEDALARYADRDPGMAGDVLVGVLQGGGLPAAASADGTGTKPGPGTSAELGAGGRDPRGQ